MSYLKSLEKDIQLQSIVVLTSIGTLLHWYGFFLVGVILAPILKNQLHMDEATTQYMSSILFVTGFFVRPLGSILFAPWIDVLGRKNLFAYSLNIIAVSLTIILIFPFELFPAYVGLIILIISRVLQGVALSLEYGAAVSYVYESVPKERSGYFIGILQLTAPLGIVGAHVVYFISKQLFVDSSMQYLIWKLPLLIGIILFAVSVKIRHRLPESFGFEELVSKSTKSKRPLFDFLKGTDLDKILYSIFGVAAVQGTLFYYCKSMLNAFVIQKYSISNDIFDFFYISVISLTWPVVLITSSLADKFNSKKVFTALLFLNFIFVLSCTNFVETISLESSNVWDLFFPSLLLMLGALSIYALSAKILVELFPTKIRGTGISIPYHLGNGIFGGSTLLISYLDNEGHSIFMGGKNYILGLIVIAILLNFNILSKEKNILSPHN